MTTQLEIRRLAPVTRGADDQYDAARFKARRVAIGLSVAALAKRAGVDRGILKQIEEGTGSAHRETTLAAIDRALAELEEETGMDEGDAPPEPVLEVSLHDVYGVGRLVVKGPFDADVLAEAVGKIVDRLKRGGGE